MRNLQVLMPNSFNVNRILMSRSVVFTKHKRKLSLHHKSYGTSSKPSTNFNAAKASLISRTKIASENVYSVISKSLAIASSVLKPIVSFALKTKVVQPENHMSFTSNKQIINQPCSATHNIERVLTTKSKDFSNKNNVENESQSANLLVDKMPMDKGTGLEQAFLEWIAGGNLHDKRKEFLQKESEKLRKVTKPTISRASLEQRSRFLVRSLNSATSCGSQLLRLEEIIKHLLLHPQEKGTMVKAGVIRTILWIKQQSPDYIVQGEARGALSLLGHHDPPNARGIRILSIDGGGTRGLMVIEILRQLEARTSKKVYQLFDFICGVSSGAILSLLLGGLRLSLDECETLYRKLSSEVFTQSPIWGTGRLMWNHAYYDTTIWLNVLKNVFGESILIDTAKREYCPKLSCISAVMNLPSLQAFVFRNYDFPLHVQSHYLGSCKYKMWQCVHASGAAPGYFEEICIDEYLHQDGGVMMNNPTALAIHEARMLWPADSIQCVFSLGCGRYIPAAKTAISSTSLKTKVLKMIDSATDTESVHVALNDLLSPNTYFRFNPYLTEFLSLDESRPEKLQQLKMDAQMYLRRNEHKFGHAVNVLSQPRGPIKRINDWLHLQKLLFL